MNNENKTGRITEVKTGSFYSPKNVSFSLLKKQLEMDTAVKIKDVLTSNKNIKPMPLTKKMDFYSDQNKCKNNGEQLKVLAEQNKSLGSKEETLSGNQQDSQVKENNILSENVEPMMLPKKRNTSPNPKVCEKKVKQSEVHNTVNGYLGSTKKDTNYSARQKVKVKVKNIVGSNGKILSINLQVPEKVKNSKLSKERTASSNVETWENNLEQPVLLNKQRCHLGSSEKNVIVEEKEKNGARDTNCSFTEKGGEEFVLKNQRNEFEVSFADNERKDVNKSVIESEGGKINDESGQSVANPFINEIKCKVSVVRNPCLKSDALQNDARNNKEKNGNLSPSRYSLYLKKGLNQKITAETSVNVEEPLDKEVYYKNQAIKEKPCLKVLDEKMINDNFERSGKISNKAKRGLDDPSSSYEISNKCLKLPVDEKRELGMPYEPVGKTLENDLCLSDEEGDLETASIAGEPKTIDFKLPTSSPYSSSSSKNERIQKLPLQEEVEKVISNLSPSFKNIIDKFKSGLCPSWLRNNFFCPSKLCLFHHNARELFRKRLQEQPSSFIIELIVAMRHDLLFVDILMEGFDILKSRSYFEKLFPFLSFFAFYASDPKDPKYASFWYKAASYYRSIIQSEDMTDGFAFLIKIFRQIDQTKQGKIINFIEMLKNPYFKVEISWKLIMPVIVSNIDVPSSLLLSVVESCNETKADVDEIYQEIVSRICVNSLSLDGVEILLQFCKTLGAANRPEKAGALKRRLYYKVQSIKGPINKNIHYQTYLYYCEIEPKDEIEDETEDFDAGEIVKNDEIKIQNRGFSSPPPNCYLNPSFFIKEDKVEDKPKFSRLSLKRSRDTYTPFGDCKPYKILIKTVVEKIRDYEFTLAGEHFNVFEGWELERTAGTLVTQILNMKMAPNEVLDFLIKATFNCCSRNSVEILSSIGISFIYHFVTKADWETAYAILKIYLNEEIDLSSGKIFDSNRIVTLNQLRIVLLIIEICTNNEKYEDAYFFVEKYKLNTRSPVLEPTSSNEELIREKVLEDLLNELKAVKSPLLLKAKFWT